MRVREQFFRLIVTLTLFQGPFFKLHGVREWMLKQVQHDECGHRR
jgi:hypothetical protein